ncbi:hypothetical protein HN419_05245 [Candidatus Woesearchaeota archaeon]|jgi:hypothetical protein|nr:hypothetical protein [Candidatus Woesearchaeota archaeon]MBT3537723.1 hypothetical protein [Candidatus Woesearchaeota archaeon]MBT4697854.1 hypothetical protein [Candidatus Woesearchaeota archaeon]MBT4717486.1 hypothetical protein [Candidatus Woesearchaeota archaeon]MBT7105392.1 hypothetical protein [Candidatus Woesearchaeota archaeon]
MASRAQSHTLLWIILPVILAVLLAAFMLYDSGRMPTDYNQFLEGNFSLPEPKQEEVKQQVKINESLETLHNMFFKEDRTDLQLKEFWRTKYENNLVEWTAYVGTVDKNVMGQYIVMANINLSHQGDMKNIKDASQFFKSMSLGSDVVIFFDDDEKESLLTLREGQEFKFKGNLDNYKPNMKNFEVSEGIILEN